MVAADVLVKGVAITAPANQRALVSISTSQWRVL